MNESTESPKHHLIIRIEMTRPYLMIRIAIPLETDCTRARAHRRNTGSSCTGDEDTLKTQNSNLKPTPKQFKKPHTVLPVKPHRRMSDRIRWAAEVCCVCLSWSAQFSVTLHPALSISTHTHRGRTENTEWISLIQDSGGNPIQILLTAHTYKPLKGFSYIAGVWQLQLLNIYIICVHMCPFLLTCLLLFCLLFIMQWLSVHASNVHWVVSVCWDTVFCLLSSQWQLNSWWLKHC